ncbi:hypothetical protein KKG83_03520, partial [Candidatus Micrarchaeota archaeon]|nr:hypothetical protein [Candidatus Micrarchaeota archaeon]
MADLKEQLNALKALVKKKEKKEDAVKGQDKSSLADLKEKEIEAEKEKLREAFNKEPEIKGTSFFQRRQEAKTQEKGKFAFSEKKETQQPEKSGLFAGSALSDQQAGKKETLQPQKKDFLSQKKAAKELSQKPEEFAEEKLNSGLSGIYYFFEDGYYGLMDKINSKIPVYKVIDPIDKIFPSFILLSLIILALIFLGVYFIFFNAVPEQKASLFLTLTKEDSNEILSDYEIILLIDSNQTVLKTNSKGKATLTGLDLNSEIKIQVKDVLNYEDFEETVKITKESTSFTIELKKKVPVDSGWQTKTIRFKDQQTSALVIEFIRVSLSCSKDNSALEVSGESSLINLRVTGGTLEIKVKPDQCGDILVSVQPTSYDPIDNQVLSGNTVYLTKEGNESETGTIHVKLFDESGLLISDLMKFSLFESTDELNPVQGFDNVSVSSGLKSLNEMPPGTYFIKTFDPAEPPKYSCHNPSEEKELLAEEEITFEVTCYLIGEGDLISVQVKDKNSGTE